jgi:hypothetical protein
MLTQSDQSHSLEIHTTHSRRNKEVRKEKENNRGTRHVCMFSGDDRGRCGGGAAFIRLDETRD